MKAPLMGIDVADCKSDFHIKLIPKELSGNKLDNIVLIFRYGLTELIEQVSADSEAASVTSYVEDFVIEDRSKMA